MNKKIEDIKITNPRSGAIITPSIVTIVVKIQELIEAVNKINEVKEEPNKNDAIQVGDTVKLIDGGTDFFIVHSIDNDVSLDFVIQAQKTPISKSSPYITATFGAFEKVYS